MMQEKLLLKNLHNKTCIPINVTFNQNCSKLRILYPLYSYQEVILMGNEGHVGSLRYSLAAYVVSVESSC